MFLYVSTSVNVCETDPFVFLVYSFIMYRTDILITPSVYSQGSTAFYHSRGQTILYSSWSSRGSSVEEGLPLGRPSKSISDETESACGLP